MTLYVVLLDGPPDEAVENWKASFTALGVNHEGWENGAMKLLLTDDLVAVLGANRLLIAGAADGANPSKDDSCFDSAWESKEFSQHYKLAWWTQTCIFGDHLHSSDLLEPVLGHSRTLLFSRCCWSAVLFQYMSIWFNWRENKTQTGSSKLTEFRMGTYQREKPGC